MKKPKITRAFRKKYLANGTIKYLSKTYNIRVKDLSTTGIFALLQGDLDNDGRIELVKLLSPGTIVDLYVSDLAIMGKANIVRIEVQNNELLIALNFGELTRTAL
jgi:hypothetical protein